MLKQKTKIEDSDTQVLPNSNSADIDTSALYKKLRREFASSQKPVEVDFRKIVDWIRIGDQLTHQIHPYPAKLLPHIAYFFARASVLFDKEKIVLDPFCGSGTVALEASLSGCTPWVSDANPLALLLTKVKTTPYDTIYLNETRKKIIKKALQYKTAPEIKIINPSLWYSPEKKSTLEKLARAIREICSEYDLDFFLASFSAVAKKMSYADPAISVPVKLKTKEKFTVDINKKIEDRIDWVKNANVYEEFSKICELNISRVDEANLLMPTRKAAITVGADARRLCQMDSESPLLAASVPLVITSPPYGSAQKYIRASSLSLNWLELAAPNELSTLESKSIGREHVPQNRELAGKAKKLPAEYEKMLKKVGSKNITREKITRKYLEEMDDVISEIDRVLAPNGRAVFVVGNNQVCGEVLRNDQFLIDGFYKRGLSLELSLLDDIKSRGLMTKRNRTASVISRESVLVFRKKG